MPREGFPPDFQPVWPRLGSSVPFLDNVLMLAPLKIYWIYMEIYHSLALPVWCLHMLHICKWLSLTALKMNSTVPQFPWHRRLICRKPEHKIYFRMGIPCVRRSENLEREVFTALFPSNYAWTYLTCYLYRHITLLPPNNLNHKNWKHKLSQEG